MITKVKNLSSKIPFVLIGTGLISIVGCNTDTDTDTDTDSLVDTGSAPELETPTSYEFSDTSGQSTVSNSGQKARHALISGLKGWMGEVTALIDDGSFQPTNSDQVLNELNFYFDCADGLCGDLAVGGSDTVQQSLDDISTGKNLVGKMAGNDSVTDHKNWTGGDFKGWAGASSPEALLRTWFLVMADQAVARANGESFTGPAGEIISSAGLTPEGLDTVQLTQKFLLGAVAFSQGSDDYLDDDDVDGKGLLASHGPSSEGKVYTDLEHAWDEGFGYFGAANNYPAYTDVQLSDGDMIDMDDDGLVDLVTEKNWGHSVNAGKRDKGAVVATDFTADAWKGFAGGRQLLAVTAGTELSDADFQTLLAHRDMAVGAWEKAISATCIHYINDVLQDMATFGSSGYSFSSHAKHWGELKGLALGLQFNPISPLSDADFEAVHTLLGDAPVLPNDSVEQIEEYETALKEARALLGAAYGFDAANLGDSGGEGGW